METVEIYTAIREIVIAVLGLIMLAVLTALKDTIQKRFETAEEREQYKKLEDLARMVVIAAEQKYKKMQEHEESLPTGNGQLNRSPAKWGGVKKEYAMSILRDKFPDLDVDTIGAYIDAAVDIFIDGNGNPNSTSMRSTPNDNVTYRGHEVNKNI